MEAALGYGPAHKTPPPESTAEAWHLKAFVESYNLQEESELCDHVDRRLECVSLHYGFVALEGLGKQ